MSWSGCDGCGEANTCPRQLLSMSPFTRNLTDRMHLVNHRTSLFWKVHKLGAVMKRKSRAPKRSRRSNKKTRKQNRVTSRVIGLKAGSYCYLLCLASERCIREAVFVSPRAHFLPQTLRIKIKDSW